MNCERTEDDNKSRANNLRDEVLNQWRRDDQRYLLYISAIVQKNIILGNKIEAETTNNKNEDLGNVALIGAPVEGKFYYFRDQRMGKCWYSCRLLSKKFH